MKTLNTTVAAMVAAVGLAASAQASELVAYRGQSIALGSVSGVAYYTVEKSGYRIVATLADADSKAVRFEAVLAPGQTMVLSSPSARGEAPVRIEISRQGDRIDLLTPAVTN